MRRKIAILSSTSMLYEALPTLVEVSGGGGSACTICPRIADWDWLKKTANAIATIVANVVETVLSGNTLTALVLASPFGAWGPVALFATGVGLIQGVSCVVNSTSTNHACYTCIFTVADPNDPCH